jgi:Flp pilus assembly protein TadD
MALSPIMSLDVWWHLKTGEIVLSEGSIPRTDPFTYTAADRTWITHEWLAGVLFFVLHRLGGADLLVVFKALLAALAVALGAGAGLVGPRARERLPALALGALLAGPLLALRAFVRPHMLTAVFIGLTLVALRLEATTGRRAWRFALVPLFLLWANLHSGFVLGLGVIALYWLGEALARRFGRAAYRSAARWRARVGTLAIVFLATLINPHHIDAFLYPWRLFARAEVRESILELRHVFHPAYQGALFLKVLLAVGLVLLVLIVRSRRRLDWALLLPGLVFGALCLRSVRGLSEFAVLIPVLVGVHGDWLGKRRVVAKVTSLTVILLAVTGSAAAHRWGVPMGGDERRGIGLGVNPAGVPDAAASFLLETESTGRVFNILGFGAYFIYTLWPDREVYVDGRLDIYEPGFLRSYGRLMRTAEGWDEACERYGITMAAVNYRASVAGRGGLRERLRTDPDWVCVFFSDTALIYARRTPVNEEILTRFGCPYDPSPSSVESIWGFAAEASARDLTRAVAAMEAMVEVTPQEKTTLVVLGQLLDASGRSAEGAEYLRRAVSLGPSSTHARLLLGAALGRAGAFADARKELSLILAAEPERVEALTVLADVERAEGNVGDALRTLEWAAGLNPKDYAVQIRLGVLLSQQGRFAEAERHYHRALAIRPGDPSTLKNLEILRQRMSQ